MQTTHSVFAESPSVSRSSVWVGWYLVGFILIVISLSFLFFSQQSLRLDEAQSLWQTSHTFTGMLKVVGQDVHVPLYHIILHYWQFFFGNDVFTARFLSLLFFVAVIPAMYLLGETLYGRRAGIMGALLVSVSPFLNWYGNEIRMYSLFTLLTILNQYFFVRIFKGRDMRGAWFGYGLTALLGMYTHYFFGLVILTQIIFFAIHHEAFPRGSLARFLGIGAVVAIGFAPWLWWVYSLGAAEGMRPLLAAPTTTNVFNTFSQFLFGFQDDHVNSLLVSLWPLAVLFGFLAMRRGQALSRETQYLILAVFVPILVVFAVSFVFQPIYLTRYLVIALPALYLVLVALTETYPKGLAFMVQSVFVMLMLCMLGVEIVSAAVPVKEEYRSVATFLADHAKPQDVVVVSAPFTIYPMEYSYKGYASLETLPVWDRAKTGAIPAYDPAKLPTEVTSLVKNHEVAWLVLSYDQGYEAEIRKYFDSHFERLYEKQFSPGLSLGAYKVRYDIPVVRADLKQTK